MLQSRSFRRFLALLLIGFVLMPESALGWGRGHRLIRLWAVAHLPEWQRNAVGKEHLDRLCRDYTSLQDRHAGGKAPELDPYCIVPGVRLSLHDVNGPEPSARALLWYLDQITNNLKQNRTDEAMKFLGVLCHWNEDPGCPSAHSSPVTEVQLKTLIPPPSDKANFNYLYGAGGIMDVGQYTIPDADYRPQLLGRTREEVALRIYQHQRLLERQAGTHIIPIVQDMMYGDGRKADQHRSDAALANARHTADIIYTVLCLATGRFDNDQQTWDEQPLTDWLPEFRGGMIPHPYYVTPFLLNQAMDAKRQLHPLQIWNGKTPDPVKAGYGMGAPFDLNFVLGPNLVYRRFTCGVGLHLAAGKQGRVSFAILVNGKEQHRTRPVPWHGAPPVIDIELPEVEMMKLTLRTIPDKGSRPDHNLTVWANPTLHRVSKQ